MTARALPSLPLVEDRENLPYLAMSAVLHVAFLVLVMSMPQGSLSLDLDGLSAQDRFVQLLLQPEQQVEEVESLWLNDASEAVAGHRGEEGLAGTETAADGSSKMAIEGDHRDTPPELQKARDTQVAMNAGALALFNDRSVSSPWATSETSIGGDALDALGRLDGDAPGDASGMRGLGLRGTGRGGPGDDDRSIGLDRVGTKGFAAGGKRLPDPDLDSRPTRVPEVIAGPMESEGSLDRDIIQRVVRRHRRELQYCYEQQLQRRPDLAGRVAVRFTIAGTGNVIAATISESSMNNPNVERCMTERIRRWVFPEPRGGGIVVVNYPFNFRS